MTLNFMHLTFFHHCGGTQDYTLHFELDHNCMIKTHIYLFSVEYRYFTKKKNNLNKARLNRCPIIRELFVGIHAFLTTYHNSLNSIFLPKNTTFLI